MENAEAAPSKQPRKRFRLSIACPLQSINVINRVVKVLYNYKRAASYKDIATACNIHPINVSQALSAAHDMGLTELAAKGLHALSEDGIEYVRLLSSGKERDASTLLRMALKKNPHWNETMTFLSATTGQSRDPLDLVLEIERKSGKQWKPAMRGRVRDSMVSILEFAELVFKEGSKITPIAPKERPELEEESQLEISPPKAERDFAMLRGDDFTFEIRRDLNAIEFAEKQFADWVTYLKKKLVPEEETARQSGGVPNQLQ
jgi:hypothetical protein